MEQSDLEKSRTFSLRYSRRFVLVLPEGASLYDSGLYWCTAVTRGRRAVFAELVKGRLLNTGLGRFAWESAEGIAPGNVQVVARAVMPDHLHLCLAIKGRLPHVVTTLIDRWLRSLEEEAHRSGALPEEERLWEDKCVWLMRVITRRRFEHCIAYTKGNRLSWVERHAHPEMFRYYEHVEHPLLPEGYVWQGYGNLRLLDEPVKVAVSLHRHEVPGTEAYVQLREWAMNAARTGGVLVGGFISPAEQRLLKEVKAAVGNVKVVVMDARPLKDFKPKAVVSAHYTEGRVLRLSVWESPLLPNEQRHRFLKNNELAHLIAEVGCAP
jgi:REP element-mobilizing transposase RayT